jgi:hypothetical protein
MNNSIDEKEEKEIQEIIQTMKRFLSDTYPKGNIKRNFHPKMHGCLKGTLEIRDDLPDSLKQGLFNHPIPMKSFYVSPMHLQKSNLIKAVQVEDWPLKC